MNEEMKVVQIAAISDPLPFTIAPSEHSESMITYTFTGSKTEGVRGIAMIILGAFWCFGGGFMALSYPLGLPKAGVLYTIYGLLLFTLGAAFVYIGIRLGRYAKSKGELWVNTETGEASFRTSQVDTGKTSKATVVLCGLYNEKKRRVTHWCVSIETDLHWVVLGAMKSIELTSEYAQVVSLETGLAIEDRTEEMVITTVIHERLYSSDKRALKNPIATERMATHI